MNSTLVGKTPSLRMPKSIAFTICANNYLAHASILARSFKAFHPDIEFQIALLDIKNDTIDCDGLGADAVVFLDELFGDIIRSLKDTYGIAELCTVVKPELFKHYFQEDYKTVLYIDPDIKVFSRFDEVLHALETNDMVLTPHMCSPTGDTGHPMDKHIMRTGVYNLGFLAVNESPEIRDFVDWWDKRCKEYGFHDLQKGHFYDQIWLSWGPSFLDKCKVLRHLGYNVANWNLHEREMRTEQDGYFVNDRDTPLRFFHFSHYKMEAEPSIASYNRNFDLESRPDIVPIFQEYKSGLLEQGYERLKGIPYAYGKREEEQADQQPDLGPTRLQRAWMHVKLAIKAILGIR